METGARIIGNTDIGIAGALTAAMTVANIITFIAIFIIVLNIILFFKIWNMTDNVGKILEIMEDREDGRKEKDIDGIVEEIETKKERTFWRWDKVPFKREAKQVDDDITNPEP